MKNQFRIKWPWLLLGLIYLPLGVIFELTKKYMK